MLNPDSPSLGVWDKGTTVTSPRPSGVRGRLVFRALLPQGQVPQCAPPNFDLNKSSVFVEGGWGGGQCLGRGIRGVLCLNFELSGPFLSEYFLSRNGLSDKSLVLFEPFLSCVHRHLPPPTFLISYTETLLWLSHQSIFFFGITDCWSSKTWNFSVAGVVFGDSCIWGKA